MKIVFNELAVGWVPFVHDHMIDPIQEDGVECERYRGLTPDTVWLSYQIKTGKISIERDDVGWDVSIETTHYAISFALPLDGLYNVTIS